MNRFLRPLFFSGLCLSLVTGCGKKEEASVQVAQEAERKLPEQEQLPVTPEAAAPSATDGSAAAPSGSPAEVSTVAAQAGDQAAYEAWFKKYHLDLNDPKMLDADPDEDGFSNRDEFLADTDPTDKNSRPGYHKLIRLKEYNEVRLPLVLESIEGDHARIRRTDQPDSKAVNVKVGDAIKGLPLKVQHVEEKEDFDKSGERVNMSKVALEDSSTKEKIVLMKDLPAKTSASYAVLVSPDGKTSLKVRQGDVFTWPTEQGTTYKVLDLSTDQAVLQQVETKKTWTIPRQ